jgi:hypothetical protein
MAGPGGAAPMASSRPTLACCVAASLLAASCQSSARLDRIVPFTRHEGDPLVLIMPADVELGERGLAAGVAPRDDWAQHTGERIEAIAGEILTARGAKVALAGTDESSADGERAAAIEGQRRIARQLAAEAPFTAKPGFVVGATRWSIGETSAETLRAGTDARYALFIAVFDTYSSTGRVVGQVAMGMAMVAAFVLLGVPPLLRLGDGDGDGGWSSAGAAGPGAPAGATAASGDPGRCPEQTGHASIIDLATGDVVWFNRVAGGCSDLRDAETLRSTLELLLTGFP